MVVWWCGGVVVWWWSSSVGSRIFCNHSFYLGSLSVLMNLYRFFHYFRRIHNHIFVYNIIIYTLYVCQYIYIYYICVSIETVK